MDDEIREYRRREDELRQTRIVAAQASTSSVGVPPDRTTTVANTVTDGREQNLPKPAMATTTRADIGVSKSLDPRQQRQSEATSTIMRRWASLRLQREMLYERERELELLRQGRIDTTSDQRRIALP